MSDLSPPEEDVDLSPLAGAFVVLGVTGGIAAYKAVELARRLVDAGAHVAPVLTAAALEFVGAQTFSALCSERVRSELFGDADPIPHTRLGRAADLVVVAPATARFIGEYAAGISRDLLVATLLATRAPVVVCPAMHTEMWQHDAVQENLETLWRRGVVVVPPASGHLAGGDVGEGRLPDTALIVAAAARALAPRRDLAGLSVLVTAGGTREPIDPVRYLTNRSSGRQGHAIAEVARRRGARVVLVTASALPVADGIEVVRVETAEEMAKAVYPRAAAADVTVMAAAVSDFRPKAALTSKWKKSDGPPELVLEPTEDILAGLAARRSPAQTVVGFAAETDSPRDNARSKLVQKGLDIVVMNDVSDASIGFEGDHNAVVIFDSDGSEREIPRAPKSAIAAAVLDAVRRHREARGAGAATHPRGAPGAPHGE